MFREHRSTVTAYQSASDSSTADTAGTARTAGTAAAERCDDDVRDRSDPRPYFRGLHPLAHQGPHHAQQVFRRLRKLLGQPAGLRDRPPTVLDVGCSYGVNAALLRHDVTLHELYTRYTDPALGGLSSRELAERDRAFYAGRRLGAAVRTIGLDTARRALGYAREASLLDLAFAEDLETREPGPQLAAVMADVDLITVTDVGRLTGRTFHRLLAAARHPVWVATFVPRAVPFGPIADALARHGLVTHRTPGTYPDRRFVDAEEQRHTLAALTDAGRCTAGREAAGWLHTELHLSRPASGPVALPLATALGAV